MTFRAVHRSRYRKIGIPYSRPKFVLKEIVYAAALKGEAQPKLAKRRCVTYRPFWHPYIGHNDAEKYKKAKDAYKKGKLKSRPNGRRWCKVRYNRAEGEELSDLEILMAKYNFNL